MTEKQDSAIVIDDSTAGSIRFDIFWEGGKSFSFAKDLVAYKLLVLDTAKETEVELNQSIQYRVDKDIIIVTRENSFKIII